MSYAILGEFRSITSSVQVPVESLASLKPQRTVMESIMRSLMSSGLGVIGTMFLWKERFSYLALAEDGLHLLDFRGEKLSNDQSFPLSSLKNVVTSVDEQWVKVSFETNGERKSFQLMRYQLTTPDGAVLTETEQLKQVGDMTKSMAEKLKAS